MIKNKENIRVALISPRAVASKNMIRRVQPPLGLCCIAAGLRKDGFKKSRASNRSKNRLKRSMDNRKFRKKKK